jgi:hypothetical protein
LLLSIIQLTLARLLIAAEPFGAVEIPGDLDILYLAPYYVPRAG